VLTTMLHGMLAQGRWQDRAGTNFADGGSNYYDTYECADARFVAVGAIEGPFYAELLDGLGLQRDGLPDRRDPANWSELKARFAGIFRQRARDAWAATFAETDACVSPVLGLTEAPHHAHNRARETFVTLGGIVQPAPAPRFARTPARLGRRPPRPGEHSLELLGELGYDDSAIDDLVAAGAVGVATESAEEE